MGHLSVFKDMGRAAPNGALHVPSAAGHASRGRTDRVFMTNIQQIMKMGQELQAKVRELQSSLEAEELEASAGGGMVSATVNGKGELKGLRIDAAVVDPADVEMLEDLVVAAVSEAQAKARSFSEERMRKAAGGLPLQLPGLF